MLICGPDDKRSEVGSQSGVRDDANGFFTVGLGVDLKPDGRACGCARRGFSYLLIDMPVIPLG